MKYSKQNITFLIEKIKINLAKIYTNKNICNFNNKSKTIYKNIKLTQI